VWLTLPESLTTHHPPVTTTDEKRAPGVLVSWGHVWLTLPESLTTYHPPVTTTDEKRTPGVLASWGHVWRGLDKGIPSRRSADEWLRLNISAWIGGRRNLDPDKYYKNLARSRFLIAPRGAGMFETHTHTNDPPYHDCHNCVAYVLCSYHTTNCV
jgi:hypothetical protein